MASKPVEARIRALWAEVANEAVVNRTEAIVARRDAVEALVQAHWYLTDRQIAHRFPDLRRAVFSPGELRRLGYREEAGDGA